VKKPKKKPTYNGLKAALRVVRCDLQAANYDAAQFAAAARHNADDAVGWRNRAWRAEDNLSRKERELQAANKDAADMVKDLTDAQSAANLLRGQLKEERDRFERLRINWDSLSRDYQERCEQARALLRALSDSQAKYRELAEGV
jgi:chromosome segregation ATPase